LLRYILCSHPHLYIPPESNFIPRLFRSELQAPLGRDRAVHTMQEILGYRVFFRDWKGEKPDPRQFVDGLPDLKPATLLAALYGQYARQKNSARWGDKSPIYSDYVPLIDQIFPQAQFIHIVRDGRDAALSMLKAYQGRRFFYVDLFYAAQTWKMNVAKARTDGAGLGKERYLELHYERLASQPEAALRAVCEFLNEDFVPAMAEPHRQAGQLYHSKGIHAATREPLNTKSVGRWRTAMPEQDQRLFQALAGDLLAELGYETTVLGRRSAPETARYFGLMVKYALVDTGRKAVRSAGIFHPTDLLSGRVRPSARSKYPGGLQGVGRER
jgi:hypothetical protein